MTKDEFFNVLINIDEITTKNLVNKGIGKYYISKFLKEGYLERIEKGKYVIKNFNLLYAYGNKLLRSGLVDDSIKCFNKCLEIKDNHLQSYFRLMIANIYIENYNEVLKYLDLLTSFNVVVGNERRYILYLLSNIVNLSDFYKSELNYFTFDDIRYENINDKNAYNENKIRGFCFHKDFLKALGREERLSKSRYISVFNEIHNLLITKISIKEKKNIDIITELISNEQFKEARDLLDCKINMSRYNVYLKKLLDEIVLLNESNLPSKAFVVNANNIYEAIDGRNYSLALSLCNRDGLFKKLLEIICNKIKIITNPTIEKREEFSLNYFTKITQENYFEVEKFIYYIYKLLIKKRSIYIIDALNDETTNVLLEIISSYPDLNAFLINYNYENRIVVRYCPKKQKEIDVKNSYIYASYFYEYKFYQDCLNICLDILHSDSPSVEVYNLLGMTYLKLGRPKDARDCFMVAYSLTNSCYFANIISKLNGANSKDLFKCFENKMTKKK